jgi:hypothetical protein
MIKFKIMVLTEREKTDVTDANVAVNWMLYATADALAIEKEKLT